MSEQSNQEVLDLSALGIDVSVSEAFAFLATDTAAFDRRGKTIRLLAPTVDDGQKVLHRVYFDAYTQAPIYGNERERNEQNRLVWKVEKPGTQVKAFAELTDVPRLNRLAILRQQAADTHEYIMLTGVIRAAMNVGIIYPGTDREVSLPELLTMITNGDLPEEHRLSVEGFCEAVDGVGLRFNQPMSIFWQHFGANQETVEKAIAAFQAHGAVDETSRLKTPGRIQQVLAMQNRKPGLPLAGFEVGTTDRAFAKNKQGFIDFVNTQIENVNRVVSLRQQSTTIAKEIEEGVQAGSLSQDEIKEMTQRQKTLENMSIRFAGTWTGGDVIPSVDETDPLHPVLTPTEGIGPMNAPVGRMTPVIDGNEVEWDFWTNSANQGEGEGGLAPASATAGIDALAQMVQQAAEESDTADEEPF